MFVSSLLTSLLLSGVAFSFPQSSYTKSPRAVYFLTNGHNNGVVSLKVNHDGTLGDNTVYPTGEQGEAAFNGDMTVRAGPDSLFSQAPLAIAGNMLFAVNAASNTLSMFTIDPHDPTKLTKACEPATLPGEFPNSVAASLEHQLVCVSLTGATAGVSCAPFDAYAGTVGAFDALRPYALGQTTPPVGPGNTVSQLLFAEDSAALRVLVKGNGMQGPKHNGFLASYPVHGGQVARTAQQTAGAPGATLFGSVNGPAGRLFTSDPAVGARVFSFAGDGTPVQDATVAIKGGAPCWTAYSSLTGRGYVATVTADRLVEVDIENAAISRRYKSDNGLPGFIDIAAAGKFVYGLSPGLPKAQGQQPVEPAVAVIDVSGDEITEVQRLDLSGTGLVKGRSAGMVAFY